MKVVDSRFLVRYRHRLGDIGSHDRIRFEELVKNEFEMRRLIKRFLMKLARRRATHTSDGRHLRNLSAF